MWPDKETIKKTAKSNACAKYYFISQADSFVGIIVTIMPNKLIHYQIPAVLYGIRVKTSCLTVTSSGCKSLKLFNN